MPKDIVWLVVSHEYFSYVLKSTTHERIVQTFVNKDSSWLHSDFSRTTNTHFCRHTPSKKIKDRVVLCTVVKGTCVNFKRAPKKVVEMI